MSKEDYTFSGEDLWLGRLSSFTRSIDSNRQLLRVILLAKGSMLLETIKAKEEAVKKVDDFLQKLGLLDDKNAVLKRLGFDIEQDSQEMPTRFIGGIDLSDVIDSGKDLLGSDDKVGAVKDYIPPIDADDITKMMPKKQQPLMVQTTKALEPFDGAKYLAATFEEKQLLNLYRLCLSQRIFVENRLKTYVKQTLNSGQPDVAAKVRESFQKIAKDIEIVQRAIVQRVHEVDNGQYQQSQQAEALETADKLTIMALQPFQHLLPSSSDVTPITFFSQETHVRTVPYCDDVVLIGIRYDQVAQNKKDPPPPFELMTIPHEIGHYIYQIADIESSPMVTVLPPKSQKHRIWYEEIFSDICGCIVAGPLVSLSLLSILASRAEALNYVEDGDHPTGVLRPFLLIKIFEILKDELNYDFTKASEGVKEYWQAFLGDKFNKEENKISGFEKTFQIQQRIDEIEPIIRAFINILLPEGDETKKAIKPWTAQNDKSLQTYVDELATIINKEELEKIEPTQLKFKDAIATNEADLLEEWRKKGPATIGGHD